MKTTAALFALAILACACATQVAVVDDHQPAPSPIEQNYPSIHDMGTEFDPGASVGVYRSKPLLEQMPFGEPLPEASSSGTRRVPTVGITRRPESLKLRLQDDGPRHVYVRVPQKADSYHYQFVRKDFHTVLHYIALRSGLHIIAQGETDLLVTLAIAHDWDQDAPDSTKKLLREFAAQTGLEMVEDGDLVIIKEPAPRLFGSPDEGYNVNLKDYVFQDACMEVAGVTGANVILSPAAGKAMLKTKVSLHLTNAKVERILQRLADLCDLKLTQVSEYEDVPVYEFTLKNE